MRFNKALRVFWAQLQNPLIWTWLHCHKARRSVRVKACPAKVNDRNVHPNIMGFLNLKSRSMEFRLLEACP